ncbi:DUF349 domain-containing protein [Tenacibaculum retecalamus]|uniref:DUF349 domain-containing protein n=1 Tax=Tenacibaculum retecalamus TaxID=3018315 RepID=UPI0023D8E7C5|nr:DUF349 domain-containing protein [Tenacibaculum retecalamus]WBX70531.1 DUF349 domain-containing protein [Tenacibaculum retecalamus]
MLENNEEKLQEPITQEETVVKEQTENAVNAVENEVANEAEKVNERHEIPMQDYTLMELDSLVEELEKLLNNYQIQQLKSNIDALKNAFNAKFGALLAEKKEAFLAEGGNSIDFQFTSPVKSAYNKLLGEYKAKRDAHYSQLDKQLKENLDKRNNLIDELKELIVNADAKTMYNDFQVIQKKWKTIGSQYQKQNIMILGKFTIIMLNVFTIYYI